MAPLNERAEEGTRRVPGEGYDADKPQPVNGGAESAHNLTENCEERAGVVR